MAFFHLILLTILYETLAHGNPCIETRGAFDIGSRRTKFQLAQVDICKGEIRKVLIDESTSVPYADDALHNDMKLSEKIQTTGIGAIRNYVNRSKPHRPKLFQGVATSIFRNAKNGPQYIEMIQQRFPIKVKVIDQNFEGQLALRSAELLLSKKPDIVWDIGGGSMQVVYPSQKQLAKVSGCRCGSVEFHEYLLKKMGRTNQSINPIKQENIEKARAFTQAFLKERGLDTKLPQLGQDVVGIGGVLGKGIPEQTNTHSQTIEIISKTLSNRINLSNAELGGKYAETAISNLLLVEQTMKALKISKFRSLEANLTGPLLVDSFNDKPVNRGPSPK
ncbi:Ppx/GppA phosphatase family protein [Pseudobacteriovorax antillogorgiicola]|uniref:Ppx/GppA phosphatase family protein n=1 Tax=Pseudobacteriovorax antillogorgiicola TaxID=1513793 RepID=A0A1Y6BAM2_9BACT|nr:hypothetical protein [Pseudobacteriovorax antillogorgiicola]TCS58901.1 Ppx/GppA phosphatase family protein [Pseudobacteriovorax antillogorgiicola]SME93382.1 Ppx/GppA phosphatase family protein [Pseudobacteriovorax antillogorgiicola]